MTTIDRDWSEKVLPSLKVFRQTQGHCDVNQAFTVPDCPPWPKLAAGLALGTTVNNIRNKGYFAEQMARDDAALQEIEFIWDHSLHEWNERIVPALETYSKKKGNCDVSYDFVVPSTSEWPEKTHGFKLGLVANRIVFESTYFDQFARNIDRLLDVGLDIQVVRPKWDQRVEPMLATFEELHGHRNVPTEYVVPSESPWNKNDWGIQLGKLKLKAYGRHAR